jgi:hypothetical protein
VIVAEYYFSECALFVPMSGVIDPSGITAFLGPVTNQSVEDGQAILVELPTREITLHPGGTYSVPLITPGFHKLKGVTLRGTLVRKYPNWIPDMAAYNNPQNTLGTPTTVADVLTDPNANETSIPNITAVQASLGTLQVSQAGFNLNPLALGFPTKLGAMNMFTYRLVTETGRVIDETSDEQRIAKFVEKNAATLPPAQFQLFDIMAKTNMCQDQVIDAGIRPRRGLRGSIELSSAYVSKGELVVMTEFNIPIPLFLGDDWPTVFMGNPRLEITMNPDPRAMFSATSRTFTSYMTTATEAVWNQPLNTASKSTKCITQMSFCPVRGSVASALPNGYDAVATLNVNISSIKLTTSDLESIIGNESTWVVDSSGNVSYPQCEIFRTGLDVFTRMVKCSHTTTTDSSQFILREQYVHSHIPASQIVAIIPGTSYVPGTTATPGDPGMQESANSDDASVFIVLANDIMVSSLVYGSTPGALVGTTFTSDYPGNETLFTSKPEGGPWIPHEDIGIELILKTNVPNTSFDNADGVPTTYNPIGTNKGAAMIPQYPNTDVPVTPIYPTSVTIEHCRLAASKMRLDENVFNTLNREFLGNYGLRMYRSTPVQTVFNTVSSGVHQFLFTLYNTRLAFLQFENFRPYDQRYGVDRMLPVAPFSQYRLFDGSNLVQESTPDTQFESFGYKYPMTLSNNDNSTALPTAMLSGSIGEEDLYAQMRIAWRNAFIARPSINLSMLHSIRSHWGVFYALNTLDGLVELPGQTTFRFEFQVRDTLYPNSHDMGIFTSGPLCKKLESSSNFVAPFFPFTFGAYEASPPALTQLATQSVITTLESPPLSIQTANVGIPTPMTVTAWGATEWVFKQSGVKTSTPTTVVTINS